MPQSRPPAAANGYASILLPMDLDPKTESRARLAVDLADRFDSRLIGVAAQPMTAPLYFEAPADGVASILEIEEKRAKEDLGKTEALFRNIAGSRNNIEWRQNLAYPLDHVLEHARAADVIVAARPRREEQAFGPMTLNGGDLVMAAGRPVLFVPPDIDRFSAKRIVIGWKDSREARRAVWDALPLLNAAQEVMVISAENSDLGVKDVALYLARHGIAASAQHQPKPVKSVADELVRIAGQEAADLIVCGAYGHSRTREWVFGGVTRDLLDHSPICCLMAH
jgi:nucleotide-binding universal stress UspA family protein